MAIQKLPEDDIAQIKSSTTITSLNGVVCGLVKNSLDAGATKITILVDYGRGNCSVEDNGSGILPAEFGPSGGLGKLYYTSRFPSRSDMHGKCGTFLASVAALSLMFITSHHREYHSHNTIKIHNSEVLARHLPSPPDQRVLSYSHGTRATVRDLFGSMPVRVKQRVNAVHKNSSSKDWEHLKYDIAALCLSWPGHVTISMRDSTNHQTVVLRDFRSTGQGRSEGAHRPEPVSRTSKILAQAGLFEVSALDSWVTVRASAGQVSINGAVCLIPVATKRTQFISLGIQPVSNGRGSNVLYEEINHLFSNSSFGAEDASDVDDAEKNRPADGSRYKTEGFTDRELRARKGIDRWPMFYIKICLESNDISPSHNDVDEVLDERRQTLQTIIDVLKMMIYEFLKEYHFCPRQIRSRKNGSSNSSASRDHQRKPSSRGNTLKLGPPSSPKSSIRSVGSSTSRTASTVGDLATTRLHLPRSNEPRPSSASPFDMWSRIKSGRPSLALTKPMDSGTPEVIASGSPSELNAKASETSDSATPPLLFDSSGSLLRAPFTDAEVSIPLDQSTPQQNEVLDMDPNENDGEITWVNPVTMKKSIIDTRTGFVKTLTGAVDGGSSNLVRATRLGSKKRLRLQPEEFEKEASPWLRDLLSSWKNPVFEAVEPPIPIAFDTSKLASHNAITSGGFCHGCHSITRGVVDRSPGVEGRISKDALREAEVIAQVDRKFILAKLRMGPSSKPVPSCENAASLLVVIDQHAADERHGVEDLMRDYFEMDSPEWSKKARARTEQLERPLQFEIASQECVLFERYSSCFERWGVAYQLYPSVDSKLKNGVKSASFLKIRRLPPSIAERCRQEPRLLIELLRKEIWKFDEHGGGKITADITNLTTDKESHWLARFHGCPQGILDMINSRACRSAIMFNDVLSVDECKGLLTRLADCAFPFQCAHGRPSMVPLVDLGHVNLFGSAEDNHNCFGREFDKWKKSITSDGR